MADGAPEKYLLRFIAQSRPYNIGECAAFVPRVAIRIVENGCAVYCDPPEGFDETGKPIRAEDAPADGGLRHNGGGWYELLDFTDDDGNPLRVHGKAKAITARDRLLAERAATEDDGYKDKPFDDGSDSEKESLDDGGGGD